jgi:hypothetical protein
MILLGISGNFVLDMLHFPVKAILLSY